MWLQQLIYSKITNIISIYFDFKNIWESVRTKRNYNTYIFLRWWLWWCYCCSKSSRSLWKLVFLKKIKTYYINKSKALKKLKKCYCKWPLYISIEIKNLYIVKFKLFFWIKRFRDKLMKIIFYTVAGSSFAVSLLPNLRKEKEFFKKISQINPYL